MKHFFLPTLLVAISSVPLFAQQSSKPKVDSLYELAFSLRESGDYTQAIKEAQKAVLMAQEIGYLKREADCYVQVGRSYKEQGHPREALGNYEKALLIRRQIRDSSGMASVYNNMSSAHDLLENYPEGRECSQLAIRIWSAQAGQEANLAKGFNNLANIYQGLDKLDSAILFNQKSIALFPTTQDTFTLAIAEQGLGKGFLEKGNYDTAQTHLEKAREIYQILADTLGQAMVSEGFGLIALRTQRFKDALAHFNLSEQLYRSIGDTSKLGNVYENLGLLYESERDYEQALSSYDSAAIFLYGKPGFEPANRKRFTGGGRLDYLQTRSDGVMLREKADKINRWLMITLALFAFAAVGWAITQGRLRKSEQRLASLKHDVIKSSLNAINNHLLTDLPNFHQEDAGYALIFKVKGMVNRLLTRIGYPPDKTYEFDTIKPFAREMHQLAMETALMMVENHSYLDEIEDSALSPIIKENLEAIVLEAFTNIQKYAKCTQCSIGFFVDENGLRLEIEDNGVGFDPDNTRNGAKGIQNIQLRAKSLNARCQILSALGGGTKIKITIPTFS